MKEKLKELLAKHILQPALSVNRDLQNLLFVSQDDPQREHLLKLGELGLAKITEVEKTGCEGVADFLYEYINTVFLKDYGEQDRVWCCKVEVRETDSNMAMRVGHRTDGEFV